MSTYNLKGYIQSIYNFEVLRIFMHFTDFKNLLFHNDILFIKARQNNIITKALIFYLIFQVRKKNILCFPMSVNFVANLDSYSQVNENIL